jgi:hypothetical protein
MRAMRSNAFEAECHPRIDTVYVRTYTVFMNITLSIDEQVAERAREKLRAVGKSLNQEIREHLERLAGDDGHLESDLEFLLKEQNLAPHRAIVHPGRRSHYPHWQSEVYGCADAAHASATSNVSRYKYPSLLR